MEGFWTSFQTQRTGQKGKQVVRHPTPAEIRAARKAAGHTQQAAAAVIYKQPLAWARYELGTREMDPALFELYQLKTGQATLTPCSGDS